VLEEEATRPFDCAFESAFAESSAISISGTDKRYISVGSVEEFTLKYFMYLLLNFKGGVGWLSAQELLRD
jgi:hypothetical protein